jgi:hypothetical protein
MAGFRMRRGSSTAWTAANPVLGQGEFGLDLNNSLFKIGNGVSSWTQLPYYTGGGIGTVSAGTTNATGPAISFANANGVTFGINGNTITASAAGGGGGGGVGLSAGTQSVSTGTVAFANSNGITFGMSGSSQITASHNGLTSQSNQALSGSNGSFTFQTATFGNLNGVSFYTSNGSLVASHNGLTTAAASDHSHGNPTLALTNLSGTTASNSAGLTLSLSAFTFENSNNVSFGLNAGTVTASTPNALRALVVGANSATASSVVLVPANNRVELSVGPSNVSFYASSPAVGISTQGNTSGTTGTRFDGNVIFVGGNNITLSQSTGVAANTITISAANQSVQTQNLVSIQGSTGNISFSNSNGITFGFNNSTITASHNGLTSQSNQAVSGSNGSFTFQTVTFGNLNGLSFYTSNGSLVGSHNGLTTAAASDHSHGDPTLALTNLSGTTASNSNGFTLSLSAAAPGGGGGGIALGNSQTTYTSGTVSLSGINLTIQSGTGNRFNFSAPATSSIVGVNGVTLSTDGSTVSVGIQGGTATMWEPFNQAVNVAGQVGNAIMHIVPLPTPAQAALGQVHIDRLAIPLHFTRSTSSGVVTLSYSFGLFTRTASTLSRVASTSYSTSFSWNSTANSSLQDGIRLYTIPWTTTISEGMYYVAHWSRSSTEGTNASLSQILASQLGSNFSGIFGVATNRSYQNPLGKGVYSVSFTTAMPSTIPFTAIDGTASAAARPPTFFMISGTA